MFFALVLVIVVEIELAIRMTCGGLIPALQENDRANNADARNDKKRKQRRGLVGRGLRGSLRRLRRNDRHSGRFRRYIDDLRRGRGHGLLFLVGHQRQQVALIDEVQEICLVHLRLFINRLVVVDDKIESVAILRLQRNELLVGCRRVQHIQRMAVTVRLIGHTGADGDVLRLDDRLRRGRGSRLWRGIRLVLHIDE